MTRIERYTNNLNLRKEGKYPGIPLFNIYPKLGKYIPSLPREIMMIFFGATGCGKTQWYKRLCINIALAHRRGDINNKPLFVINLLEESIEEFEDSLITMLYYDYFKKDIIAKKLNKISKLKLNSYSKDILTDDELKKIKEVISPVLDELLATYFVLEDSIYNPYGIYRHARDISNQIGVHTYTKLYKDDTIPDISLKEYSAIKISNPQLYERYKWGSYTLIDNNIHPIIITDHIAKLSNEKENTPHQTLSDWSFNYCRKIISKNWKWNVLNIMQQTVYSENKTYSFKNELNWENLKPGLSDVGTNKEIAQDHHVILGAFNPYRYASNGTVDGVDLAKSKGRYRSTKILKNRIGEDQIEIPWYFDGAVGAWNEISLKNIDAFYQMCNI